MQVIFAKQHWVPIAILVVNISFSIGSEILNCKDGIKEHYILFVLEPAFS